MKKILIFNWKMNPVSADEAVALAKASDNKNVIIAPPFLYLEKVGKTLKHSSLAAQNLFYEKSGAFTGEVSSAQIKNIGAEYVLLGHSERRHKFGETDDLISKKLSAAVEIGLNPILCVGETKIEKDAGRKEDILETQINIGLLDASQNFDGKIKKTIIAYEPVWAIGTNNPETPESALETILYIKSVVLRQYGFSPKVLYGGSVNSQNLESYIKFKEIDGALVGGASLKKDEIKKMLTLK